MAKPEEDREKEIWGSWEELLLACAVNRHGTKNWDLVSMEIKTRTSAPHLFLTPQNCKQKYHDLHRRFTAQRDDKTNDDTQKEESDHKKDDKIKIPWLDELRKRRVAELKREVQRYDVSIVSLQLKVKRLKEERERNVRDSEDNDAKPDLEKGREEEKKEDVDDNKPARSSPESVEGNPVSSEESGRENQSFNESNSTDQKGEKRDVGGHESSEKEQEPKPEPESGPAKSAAGEPDPVSAVSPGEKLVAEGSYNGSSDTIAKDSTIPAAEKSSEAVPTRKAGDSPELWESVAESKGGEDEGSKENSDVQSSASLSKKNRRKKEVSASSSGGEEPETEEVSPAIERVSVESEPLATIIEIIKSHKHGTVFERRLESQESARYKGLIRQHMDLRTVETRLKDGWYSGCRNKFYRDILLLFNNAIVFFPKNSTEFSAATELRHLVSKKITWATPPLSNLQQQQPEESTPPAAVPPPPSIPKPDPEPSDSLLAKQKSSGPTIVCRKRSSITAKASTTSAAEKKGEQKAAPPVESKKTAASDPKQPDNASKTTASDRKQPDNASKTTAVVVEEQGVVNKRKRDGSAVSGTRSSRSSSKNRNNNNNNNSSSNNPPKNSNLNSNQNPSSSTNVSSAAAKGGTTADDGSETKTEKEKKNNNSNSNNVTTTVAKKRSVANFLNRMKRNSSSSSNNNGTLLETLKNSSGTSGKSGVAAAVATEQKKSGGGRKEQGGGGSRQKQAAAQEQSSPAKRSVGRPPKRSSAPPPPPPSKRTRETVETETVAASRQPRKRSRR